MCWLWYDSTFGPLIDVLLAVVCVMPDYLAAPLGSSGHGKDHLDWLQLCEMDRLMNPQTYGCALRPLLVFGIS